MKSAVEYSHGSNGSARLQPLKYREDLIGGLHLKRKLGWGKELLNAEWLPQPSTLALGLIGKFDVMAITLKILSPKFYFKATSKISTLKIFWLYSSYFLTFPMKRFKILLMSRDHTIIYIMIT